MSDRKEAWTEAEKSATSFNNKIPEDDDEVSYYSEGEESSYYDTEEDVSSPKKTREKSKSI